MEIRNSVGQPFRNLRISVNGVERTAALPQLGNDPSWRHTNWGSVRFEDVALAAGATNTVELFPTTPATLP